MSDNFIIYRDRGGKMPQLRRHATPQPWATHPYYTVYRNNKPVKTVPYPGQNADWDFSINEFVTLETREVVRGAICYG